MYIDVTLTIYICHALFYSTQYIQYHPGGVAKLMMGAGKDCTALFNKYHQWVNAMGMIGKCLVGTYQPGTSTGVIEEGDEEES